ncbi:transposase family protein [Streptomyces californicus]|uniref:transposase family protein n=1 Tax=Streptomyces californicus TaxID=67351 RepID=UPI00378FF2A0
MPTGRPRSSTAPRSIRVRRPAAGRKDREAFISVENKQNAVKTMVVTDGDGRVLFCSPARPGSCAGITHARQPGLVKLLADGPAVEILADAGYQGLGAHTGGRVITPPHRKFKKNALRTGTRRCTSGSARRPPQDGSGSSTASPT